MLLLRTITVDLVRPILPRGRTCYFHSAPRFATLPLAHQLDSLVRVSRRVAASDFAHILRAEAASLAGDALLGGLIRDAPPGSATETRGPANVHGGPQSGPLRPPRLNTSEDATFQRDYPAAQTDVDQHNTQCSTLKECLICAVLHSLATLPPRRFHILLTPFSRCFSSFPHGTCLLSVSHLYLALDGVYHPLELHSQTTRLAYCLPSQTLPRVTGVSPSLLLCSKRLTRRVVLGRQCNPTTRTCGTIPMLRFSLFTRRYWGNPCWCLFLRLLICLSSAGSLV
jgi:hypothetical protein|eukprot:NODE_32_length_32166_cov_0.707737.p5 type:complete len:283 gc:universal NODE_32_length_32166_cov_0.707737:28328-29176(+)